MQALITRSSILNSYSANIEHISYSPTTHIKIFNVSSEFKAPLLNSASNNQRFNIYKSSGPVVDLYGTLGMRWSSENR